jgi:hypothetical protein
MMFMALLSKPTHRPWLLLLFALVLAAWTALLALT